MEKFFHSVTLDKDSCIGCTNCVKRCPTEAIRVRDGKATIIKERCIDCGECIRICKQYAKKAVVDPLSVIKNYKYTVALPAPTLYGQFKDIDNINVILSALKRMGFDDVFEVSIAAEAVSAVTRQALMSGHLKKPIISSACPAVIRIIRVRFPTLLSNILCLRSPMDNAAGYARQLAAKKTGLRPEDIGCIFISPCPAKATSAKVPLGIVHSSVDAVVSIAELYPLLLSAIKEVQHVGDIQQNGWLGVGWAVTGGEAEGTSSGNSLAADGIENVIGVLEALEDDRLPDVDFVELNACTGGCVGGVLTVENPFIARTRINRLSNRLGNRTAPYEAILGENLWWDYSINYEPVMKISSTIAAAMEKLARVEALAASFNGMDCGACGAPSCRAMAEDICDGRATEDQCVFRMREHLQTLLTAANSKQAPDKATRTE